MSTLVNRIQHLIKTDRMEQALKELEAWAERHDSDLHNTVIIQMARFNQLRRNERMGLISREESYRLGNQINYAVLSMLDDIPQDIVVSASTESATIPTDSRETKPVDTMTSETKKKAPRKLFISYAREDLSYVKSLKVHLASLIKSGDLASWEDSRMLAGEEWNPKIESELRSADIVIYIVSAYFLSSDFINNYERVWAEETKRDNGALIVPVLVRPTVWESEDFARYNAIPRHPESGNLKPISKWEDKDEAYTTVVRGLKRIIDTV